MCECVLRSVCECNLRFSLILLPNQINTVSKSLIKLFSKRQSMKLTIRCVCNYCNITTTTKPRDIKKAAKYDIWCAVVQCVSIWLAGVMMLGVYLFVCESASQSNQKSYHCAQLTISVLGVPNHDSCFTFIIEIVQQPSYKRKKFITNCCRQCVYTFVHIQCWQFTSFWPNEYYTNVIIFITSIKLNDEILEIENTQNLPSD